MHPVLRHRKQGLALVGKNQERSPGTCTGCMGRGTRTDTKKITEWKVDEKGLPFAETTTTTAIVSCGDCEGRGVR